MNERPLRILQVGMGSWGRDWASRVLPEVPGVELAGCVDPDPTARKLAGATVGLPARRIFARLEEGLAAVEPDAVLVTTILPGHVPVARAALEAGKHVLVEKPFAPSVAEGRALVELAAERGLTLMVSQNYRFFPAVLAVADLVRNGELGRLHGISIDFRRYSSFALSGPSAHFAYEQPLLVDMSIHHFDLLRMILGREPARVTCEAWNPPWSGFAGPPAESPRSSSRTGRWSATGGAGSAPGRPTPGAGSGGWTSSGARCCGPPAATRAASPMSSSSGPVAAGRSPARCAGWV